jgi:hypothetical protein
VKLLTRRIWPTGLALWSPEYPNLYDLLLELLDPDGEVLDRVEGYFGMRKIEVKDSKVLLNDRPLYQRLVLDRGYFPEGLLTAPTDEDLRRDIELAYRDAEALAKSYTTPESAVAAEPANHPVYVPGYAYRGEPILITEFGGIAFSGDEEGWDYTTVASSREFLEIYEALIAALLRCEPVQGFCYTQLTDVEQEVNGMLTYDRVPKADLTRIREITTRPKPTD